MWIFLIGTFLWKCNEQALREGKIHEKLIFINSYGNVTFLKISFTCYPYVKSSFNQNKDTALKKVSLIHENQPSDGFSQNFNGNI